MRVGGMWAERDGRDGREKRISFGWERERREREREKT